MAPVRPTLMSEVVLRKNDPTNRAFIMNKKLGISSLMASIVLLLGMSTTPVVFAVDNEVLSGELTTLYRAARKVISVNQKHINDPSVGDKGLSAEVVVRQAKENYKAASGKELDMNSGKEAKEAMLAAVYSVMDEAQDLINEPDVGLKGFLPAIFARQVANRFNSNMIGKMKIKLTAPKSYIRNRANRPDKWEANVIETMFKNDSYEKGKPFFENAKVQGKQAYRYILPEYYGTSCLSCHGQPKGNLDITGGRKEGGVLGELGGAISLSIFD